MVYWRVETDYVAIAIYIVLLVKAVLLNKRKDFTDRMFSLSLILGFLSTCIDVYSSVMMNDSMSWWAYEISMLLYGLSVPVLALFWLLYTVSLIYRENETVTKRFAVVFLGLYAVYAAVILTNPIHELYFHLTPDIVYARGVLFLPLIVGSQTFLSAMGILLLLGNWKRIASRPLFFLLLFLHFVTAASYYIQIANPGWLIICSTYAVAFLVCDATFESRRRDSLYKTITESLEQLQRDKEREQAYQEKLKEAAEDAMRANQAKSEFLSRMSHDIRTPINGIRGMLGIIRKERHDDERVDDCLHKIETASGYLLALINDVLDMSKLESGEIVLAKEPFDLWQVASDCRSVLGPAAVEGGVSLTGDGKDVQIDHPYLIGSPLHLRQIMLNIAGNAIKYNRHGGTVRCAVEELTRKGDVAVFRFTVQDTGIGISPEFMPHLFQPFAQEHAGSRTHYEGTGLGLAIVEKIVQKMGGEITVDSTLGEGSTFIFTLPFVIDRSPTIRITREEDEIGADGLSGVKLLVVEDNDLNMEIAQYILEDAGAEVELAMNGQEAVEQFEASPPGTFHAILMDVMMPVMNGLDATRTIRALDRPDAKTIPIIAMTANAFSEDVEKCREAGMDKHLAKPLDAEALIKALTDYIAPA